MVRESSGETFYAFLGRRKQELEHRIAAVRSELEALETELAHVASAHRQVGTMGGDNARFGKAVGTGLRPPAPEIEGLGIGIARYRGGYGNQTIKQLILRAFRVQFGGKAVTSNAIRAFIRDGFGRDIDRNSLAPQLSRLKDDGLVENTEDGRWRVTLEGEMEVLDQAEALVDRVDQIEAEIKAATPSDVAASKSPSKGEG